MKEQFICEILHYLPSFSADQLTSVKEAIRIVLCKYDLDTKETSLQIVDNSSLHYLQMYLESCEQSGKSNGTVDNYQFHLSHFLSYVNKDIRNIIPLHLSPAVDGTVAAGIRNKIQINVRTVFTQ